MQFIPRIMAIFLPLSVVIVIPFGKKKIDHLFFSTVKFLFCLLSCLLAGLRLRNPIESYLHT
jgi:hypothetical protein